MKEKTITNNPHRPQSKAWRDWNRDAMADLKEPELQDSGDDLFRELRHKARLLTNTRPGASREDYRNAIAGLLEEADRVLGSDWPTVRTALQEFVNDINTSGGVYRDHRQHAIVPIGDPTWEDLAFTYLHACKALGIKPKFSKNKPSDLQP